MNVGRLHIDQAFATRARRAGVHTVLVERLQTLARLVDEFVQGACRRDDVIDLQPPERGGAGLEEILGARIGVDYSAGRIDCQQRIGKRIENRGMAAKSGAGYQSRRGGHQAASCR